LKHSPKASGCTQFGSATPRKLWLKQSPKISGCRLPSASQHLQALAEGFT
jgi:hypothetical protein